MRLIEITDESITRAGLECFAEGRINVNGFALRHKLGGGDPSWLQRVWSKHRAFVPDQVEKSS